jgi:hypothetical protein
MYNHEDMSRLKKGGIFLRKKAAYERYKQTNRISQYLFILSIMRGFRTCSTHGRYESAYNILVEKMKGRGHSEELGVDGRIILEQILGKWGRKKCTGFI